MSSVCLYEEPVPHMDLSPLRILELFVVNQSVKHRFARRSRSAEAHLMSDDLPNTGLIGKASELLLADCCSKFT